MSVVDIMILRVGSISPPSKLGKERETKKILKKNLLKIRKIVQLSGIKRANIRCFYSKKRFGCSHPKNLANIRNVQLSGVQLSGVPKKKFCHTNFVIYI